MNKYILSLAFGSLFISCNDVKSIGTKETTSDSEQIIAVTTDYNELFSLFTKEDNTLYVVNYWATWCTPCVEELPHFMEVNQEFSLRENFKMILVSLDKADELESDVQPFVQKNNITTDVYILSDNKRMTQWIPLVNEKWSGAIPATALYKNGQQVAFTEGQLTKEELKALINKHI